MSAYMIMVCV